MQTEFIVSDGLNETSTTQIQQQKTTSNANPNNDEQTFYLQNESQSQIKLKPQNVQPNNHYNQLGNGGLSYDSRIGSERRSSVAKAYELKNASTPIVVSRLSDSSVSIRPQSVILSRLSASKKAILSNEDGNDLSPDKVLDIVSDK